MVQLYVMNRVIIVITENYYIVLDCIFNEINGNRDRSIFCWNRENVKHGCAVEVLDDLGPFPPCNKFHYKIITKLLHRILMANMIFTHQIDRKQ